VKKHREREGKEVIGIHSVCLGNITSESDGLAFSITTVALSFF